MQPNKSDKPKRNQLVTALLRKISGQANVLSFPRVYAKMLGGDVEAAIFLSQCVYWSDRCNGEAFYKTYKDWEEEIFLSEYKIRRALEKCKAWITTEVHRANNFPTVHYKVNFEALTKAMIKFLESEYAIYDNEETSETETEETQGTESQKTSETLTEITTKTKTEITFLQPPAAPALPTSDNPQPEPKPKRARSPKQLEQDAEVRDVCSTFSEISMIPVPPTLFTNPTKNDVFLWLAPARRIISLHNGNSVKATKWGTQRYIDANLSTKGLSSVEYAIRPYRADNSQTSQFKDY